MDVEVYRKYSLGDYELDPANHLLMRGGTPLSLSRKRFQVLLYLIEHQGRLVTREELLALFWDSSEVYEENLTKCVSEIRKALADQTKPHKFIETVPAVGYRYIGPREEEALPRKASSFEIERTRGIKIVVEQDETNGAPLVGEKVLPSQLSAPIRTGLLPLASTNKNAWIFTPLLLFAVIGIAAGGFAIYRSHARTANSSSAPIRSIAILPFTNLSGAQAEDYFSDGMTESLISALSKISEVKVISRGSVFSFKGKEVDPREVGKQLNVAAILEGSVRKDETSVRVAVRLVSAEDGRVLWSNERSDRKIADIFGLQDEIAQNVVAGLRVRLNEKGAKQLTKRYTENTEAYQLYLKGRYFWNKRTPETLKKAVEFFNQAIEKDVNYSLAYAGLADCYSLMSEYGDGPPSQEEGYSNAKAAAIRALEIDDTLAEAHTSLAFVLRRTRDLSGAEPEFERAIELNPNYATAHHWYAGYLRTVGRQNEALAEIKRALELDPLSLIINTAVGTHYYNMRQYDQAMEQLHKTLEMDPSFIHAHAFLGLVYGQKGMYEEAIKESEKTREVLGNVEVALSNLGYIYALSGRRAEAQSLIEELKQMGKRQRISPTSVAQVYAGLREKDEAFNWLERAYEEQDLALYTLKQDPAWDNLRSDPRFTELLRRIGPPQSWQSSNA